MPPRLRSFFTTHASVIFFLMCGMVFLWQSVLPILASADRFSDFASYYYPARALTSGLNVYDPQQVNTLAAHTIPFWKDIGPYLYPPFFLFFMWPLTFMSYVTAKLLWLLINLGMIVLIGRELYQLSTSSFRRSGWWWFAGLALLFAPLERVLAYGQLELLIVWLLLVSFRAAQQKRPALAGIMIGIAAALKLYPLFFLLFYALRKQWKTCVVAISIFILCAGGTFLFLPKERFITYTHTVIPNLLKGEASKETVGSPNTYAGTRYWPGNHSLTGAFSYTLTQQAVTSGVINNRPLADLLIRGGSIILFLLCLILIVRYPHAPPALHFSLLIITFLLINPLTWEHYLVLTLPCIFFIINGEREAKQDRWALWLLGAIWLILSLTFYYWHPWARHGIGTLWLTTKTITLVLLYTLLCVLITRTARTHPTTHV